MGSSIVQSCQGQSSHIFQYGYTAFIREFLENQSLIGLFQNITAANGNIADLCGYFLCFFFYRFIERNHLWLFHAAQIIAVEICSSAPGKCSLCCCCKGNVRLHGVVIYIIEIFADRNSLHAAFSNSRCLCRGNTEITLCIDIVYLTFIKRLIPCNLLCHLAGAHISAVFIHPSI